MIQWNHFFPYTYSLRLKSSMRRHTLGFSLPSPAHLTTSALNPTPTPFSSTNKGNSNYSHIPGHKSYHMC